MNKACIAFEMTCKEEALDHMDLGKIIEYGDCCNGHNLYTWDDGHRYLARCRNCGGLVLVQFSEFHSYSSGDDSYYKAYIPVSSPEEAEEINKKYNGYELEKECKGIFA